MDLADKIKKVIKDSGLKDAEFAMSIGVSIDRIRNLCHGKVKKLQQHEKTALRKIYNVREAWWESDKAPQYLTGNEIEISPTLDSLKASTDAVMSLDISDDMKRQVRDIMFAVAAGKSELIEKAFLSKPTTPDGFILVPHYEIQVSAGHGALVHSEQIVDYLAFKADWVRNTLGVAQKDLALISVKGDSMEPTLSNEDLILVDMRKSRVEDNAIYVLQLEGTLLVKRIQRKLDGTLHVMSDNARYQPEVVGADRASGLHVLGRVVWSGRRM